MMQFSCHYDSPLGGITLSACGDSLIGLWFEGQKYFGSTLGAQCRQGDLPVLDEALRWLDVYFSGRKPDFTPKLLMPSSPFRQQVWQSLLLIPYGQTTTYGNIARGMAAKQGLSSVSAQAVGGAVGHNPISIIVPCHRVVGATGCLTGYAGGIDRKLALLRIEDADTSGLWVPRRR